MRRLTYRTNERAPDQLRPPLATSKLEQRRSHRQSLRNGRHHFFALTFKMALSNVASVNCFFSLAFASVKSFNRCASDKLSPPYMAVHLWNLHR